MKRSKLLRRMFRNALRLSAETPAALGTLMGAHSNFYDHWERRRKWHLGFWHRNKLRRWLAAVATNNRTRKVVR